MHLGARLAVLGVIRVVRDTHFTARGVPDRRGLRQPGQREGEMAATVATMARLVEAHWCQFLGWEVPASNLPRDA
jgi:hypothetical protein